MTDNEIIKALECCTIKHDCNECPYKVKKCKLLNSVLSDALDLIIRQQAEIEELKSAMNCYRAYEEEQKSEAIKEFAERLNEKTISTLEYCEVVLPQEIDNLVKEMVGEDE